MVVDNKLYSIDMLSQKLKEQTKEMHQQLESVVVRQIKQIRSREDYVRLLQKFYGYFLPLELKFDQQLNDDNIPKYSHRRKAFLLLNDLKSLNELETPALTDGIPVIDSLPKALGAFYVLEGSTQGGNIVADMLTKYANVTPDSTSFFRAYGDDKTEMWRSFIERLNEASDGENFEAEVIESANQTFSRFREWMSEE